jgi:hypothetical protein
MSRTASSPDRAAKKRLLEQENEVLRRAAAYLSQANLPGNGLPARLGWTGITADPARARRLTVVFALPTPEAATQRRGGGDFRP